MRRQAQLVALAPQSRGSPPRSPQLPFPRVPLASILLRDVALLHEVGMHQRVLVHPCFCPSSHQHWYLARQFRHTLEWFQETKGLQQTKDSCQKSSLLAVDLDRPPRPPPPGHEGRGRASQLRRVNSLHCFTMASSTSCPSSRSPPALGEEDELLHCGLEGA